MEVDPSRLRTIAGNAADTAGTVGRAFSSRSGALAPAGSGWSVSGAVRAAAGPWESLARRLGTDFDTFSTNLVRAAETYLETDENAADSMRALRQRVGQVPP